jgi:peptidoglycan hydrolase-like protein with peptidoglycan-binding domain
LSLTRTRTGQSFFDLDIDESPEIEPLSAPAPTRRPRRIVATALGAGAIGAVAVSLIVPLTGASADPSSSSWSRLRNCESSNDYSINTGNGYYGAYQFNLGTWRSVGGRGYPNKASRAEQDARALILYRERGWQPWTCASILGLHEDSDARSGHISDISVSGGTNLGASDSSTHKPGKSTAPTSGPPAWPGSSYAELGSHNSTVARWQAQMHKRGSILVGSGYFGPNTLAVVKRIQGQNGLAQTGLLGPVTWKLAWTGTYRDSAAAAKPASGAAKVGPAHSAPAFPGTTYWSIGTHSSTVAAFQRQMHRRGSTLTGSGTFGTHTLGVVKRLQRLNHLPQTGLLGPVTWKLAWTGRY